MAPVKKTAENYILYNKGFTKDMNIDFDKKLSSDLLRAKEARERMREARFAEELVRLGEESVAALREFYSLYDEGLYKYSGLPVSSYPMVRASKSKVLLPIRLRLGSSL